MKEMVVAVPNMGPLAIVARGIFKSLGIPIVTVPRITREMIERGVKYSPEFACFPLKAVLGNFMKAAEMGATHLLIFGGGGPCRFGLYGVTLDYILKDLGYDAKVLIFDTIREEWSKEMYKEIGFLDHRLKIKNMARALFVGYYKLRLAEYAEKLAGEYRAYQVEKGAVDRVLKEAYQMIDEEFSIHRLMKMKKKIKEMFDKVEKDMSREVVRVGIVGEIYMTVEPTMNLELERRLGELGAVCDRNITAWNYVTETLKLNRKYKYVQKLAKPYLKYHAGGKSSYSVGFTIDYALKGYDGVVHIMPFGCMPEIIAQSIINKVSKDYNIPVLEVVLDEHVAEAGLQTRLEAFVDLLFKRKIKR